MEEGDGFQLAGEWLFSGFVAEPVAGEQRAERATDQRHAQQLGFGVRLKPRTARLLSSAKAEKLLKLISSNQTRLMMSQLWKVS